MPTHRHPIRVLIVDDHAGIRAGLTRLIDSENPNLCTVGAAATAAEALAQTHKQQPDVVVLDINLAGEDGLALLPALHRAAPCEVIVLTSLADPDVAAHARRLGARACLHKAAPASELMAMLFAVRETDRIHVEPPPPMNAGVVLSQASGSKHP